MLSMLQHGGVAMYILGLCSVAMVAVKPALIPRTGC